MKDDNLQPCADRLATEKLDFLTGLPHNISGTMTGDSKMKHIFLTQGQIAIVDDELYEWLSQWKWYALWNIRIQGFYAMRGQRENGSGKLNIISMAREILGLKYGDKRQSDHINHSTLDNRILNLRIVTSQQNHFNRKNPKGYYWHKTNQKYLAQIKINNKKVYLGYFHTAEEAHNAYLEAKEHYHKIKLLTG